MELLFAFYFFYFGAGMTLGISKLVATWKMAHEEKWTPPCHIAAPLINSLLWTAGWPLCLLLEALF